MDKLEFILCAAVHFDDGKEYQHQPKNITTGLVMCGFRHCSIFTQTKKTVKERIDMGIKEEQGFLTSKNRFVNRIEGAKIAFEAGQIVKEIKKLYSEDLY